MIGRELFEIMGNTLTLGDQPWVNVARYEEKAKKNQCSPHLLGTPMPWEVGGESGGLVKGGEQRSDL